MINYKLYDIYDGKELLGGFTDLESVAAACNIREAETDGECIFQLWVLSNETHSYELCENWTYNADTVNIKRE